MGREEKASEGQAWGTQIDEGQPAKETERGGHCSGRKTQRVGCPGRKEKEVFPRGSDQRCYMLLLWVD